MVKTEAKKAVAKTQDEMPKQKPTNDTKKSETTEAKVKPKVSGLKPVESKPKKKAAVPTRAANDPRYKG